MPVRLLFQPFDYDGSPVALGDVLVEELGSGRYSEALLAVAFATSSGTSRLGGALKVFTDSGGTAQAYCGISNGVTSKQAIEHLHQAGASVIGVDPGPGLLFHQKVYRFVGPRDGLLVIGSNNLTAPGLYEHLEASTIITLNPTLNDQLALLNRPSEHLSRLAERFPDNLLSISPEHIAGLVADGRLRDETAGPSRSPELPDDSGDEPVTEPATSTRSPRMPVGRRPPAAAEFAAPTNPAAAATGGAELTPAVADPASLPAGTGKALLIQIRPHNNGEILLSKLAVDENPEFFGWPFEGETTPKLDTNEPYFERDPDPVVHIRIHPEDGSQPETIEHWNLNTVYYERKSEIRITIPPKLARSIPQDSMLVMRTDNDVDYTMDIYPPGSDIFDTYLAQCDRQMPSGGSLSPRRFGWIS